MFGAYEGVTLKSRAVVFAIGAGAVSFILALVAGAQSGLTAEGAARAVIAAIVCSVMCWACAERALQGTASAIDAAIARLTRGTKGDLDGPIPPEIGACVPQLSSAMGELFRQLGSNLESVHRLAMFDSVTALPNRTNFRSTCDTMLANLAPSATAALFFIDLDRFKAVNDTMGHAMGDLLLGMVADRLRAVCAHAVDAGRIAPPLIGRLAGDEFTIFFPELRGSGEAAGIGRALLGALGESFDLAGTETQIGASIGVAMHPLHGRTLHDLMRAADAAMYHAKASGRGRVELFSDSLEAEIAVRARLEYDLREAITDNQFALVFQPQVAMSDGRIVAAEALIRWRHPTEGLKLPGSFLQRAEETGLIVEIGDWVVGEVAATIARWGRIGIEQRLAINISPKQLDHAAFFRRLREAMLVVDAPAHLLELEITETLATTCSNDVLEAIALLRSDGATIAIDDFGTGYSNLARLRDLPVDRVKLDRSLIEDIVERPKARTIAHAVVGLIHGLGCEAVAEGVETQAQADLLRVLGCDVVQGYAIAQPMDERAFVEWSQQDVRRSAAG